MGVYKCVGWVGWNRAFRDGLARQRESAPTSLHVETYETQLLYEFCLFMSAIKSDLSQSSRSHFIPFLPSDRSRTNRVCRLKTKLWPKSGAADASWNGFLIFLYVNPPAATNLATLYLSDHAVCPAFYEQSLRRFSCPPKRQPIVPVAAQCRARPRRSVIESLLRREADSEYSPMQKRRSLCDTQLMHQHYPEGK